MHKSSNNIATLRRSHNRPYRVLNIDVGIEFARQHASDADLTIEASQRKRRESILPTYNNYTSDQPHAQPIQLHA